MTIVLLGKANTISRQLARLQSDLRGVVKSGPAIRWDGDDVPPITSEPGWDGRRS